MNEKKTMFILNLLKNCTAVYFDTFFVFYFFKVANYELIPLAKYYLTLYFFTGVGFFIIRNFMKKNIKVPFFRIGIALQALYISLIMVLKDNIINYIYVIGILKGIADGFYHYPKNILSTEKVENNDRQKFDGLVNTIRKSVEIIVPLLLGILLTYYSYIDVGKIFFLLFIIMFFLSFKLKDNYYQNKKVEIKEFLKVVKNNKNIKKSLWIPFFSGITYSSGVMGLIVTLFKINNFKTNLNLGIVDSMCGLLALIICLIFALKLKKEKFGKLILGSGIISFIVMILFSIYPSRKLLILYLIIRSSLIVLIDRISSVVVVNLSNSKELKSEYKTEYYLFRDIMYAISRCFGYSLLFIVSLTLGLDYINYLMIVCAIAIFLETYFIYKIINKKVS